MDQNMAKKIHDLRISQKMTLEDVANIVGVGKSTVRKWETGMIANMRRDKIADLAKALNTTPAYLMGWEEPEKKEISSDDLILTEGEKAFIRLLRRFPAEEKPIVLEKILSELDNRV